MKKILLRTLLLVLLSLAVLLAQNLNPSLAAYCLASELSGSGGSSTSFLSSVPGLKGTKIGQILVNPYVQLGYQRNGINLSVPIEAQIDPFPAIPIPHLAIGTTDVVLKDYNFWMGTLGLNAIISPKLTLFGSVTGFQPHDFVQSGQTPISLGDLGFISQLAMTGSKLEYWVIQCGASYGIGGGYSVLGGFIWGKTAMEYTNPRRGDVPLANQTIRQDFLLKNWVPFIGLQFMEPNYYRFALIYSPLVTSSGALVNRTSQPVMTNMTYNLNQPGNLLSFTFEYFLQVPPPTMLSLWFNGTTQIIRGSSDMEFEAPGIFLTRNVSTLSLTQYSIGGGVTFALIF
jgi:hypothetical protein